MPSDLTAILLRAPTLDEQQIRTRVHEVGITRAFVRVAPLSSLGLMQVEVCDLDQGLPCENPELVAALSTGARAVFVHVNHEANQAMVHGFDDGKELEGYSGAPDDTFTEKLRGMAGHALEEIAAADDGTRLGIGLAASGTMAQVEGEGINVPPGTPTGMGSFVFHDRGAAVDEGEERMSFIAFDPAAPERFWRTPANELAALFEVAPEGIFGPLEGAKPEVLALLAELGSRTPEEGELRDVRALELYALMESRVFAGGDQLRYWDERVLPMLTLGEGTPMIEASEVDDLDDLSSVLEAMLEVLPFAAPPSGEGSVLANLGDDELGPLAPWAKSGEEYRGSIWTLKVDRLFELTQAFDGRRLKESVERFEHAWYRAARPGLPEGDAFLAWKRAKEEEGMADLDRFTYDWAELRTMLEIAVINRLQVGVIFYA